MHQDSVCVVLVLLRYGAPVIGFLLLFHVLVTSWLYDELWVSCFNALIVASIILSFVFFVLETDEDRAWFAIRKAIENGEIAVVEHPDGEVSFITVNSRL